jgi:hypothetical protein
MKKKVLISLISFLITVLYSCKAQVQSPVLNSESNRRDTILKEIPINKNGKQSLYYKITKEKINELGLDSLESGYDSLQIRIWFDYSLAFKKHLIVLKRNSGVWHGEFYTYKYYLSTNTIGEKSKNNVTPKSGWNHFVKELFGLKIISLPNGLEIPGLGGGEDGASYNIEVATKNLYRYYSYWSPKSTENKFWQAKNMVQIIKLLEREFNFKRSQE